MILPHPDLPIINSLIPLGSRGDYSVFLGFHSKTDFVLPFYIYHFSNFSLYENVLLNVSTCTETENIATATSTNGRLMRRGQCITCGKTKTQFVKKGVAGGSFLNTKQTSFEMHLQDITLLAREQNYIND